MGIYEKPSLNFKQFIPFLKPLAIIFTSIIIIYLVFLIISSFQPTAISASFSKNPLKLNEDKTILSVVITNVTDKDAQGIIVEVLPIDTRSLDSEPKRQTITLLGKGENRKLDFKIIPVKAPAIKLFPGNYRIIVKTTINNQDFEKEFVLTLTE